MHALDLLAYAGALPLALAHELSLYGWLAAGFSAGALLGLIGARFSRRGGEAAVDLLPPTTQATGTSMTVRPGAIGSGANDAFPPDTRHAILAQQMDSRSKRASGPILAAIRLD